MTATPRNEDEVELFNARVPVDVSKSDKPAIRALADLPGATDVEALGIAQQLTLMMRKIDDIGESQSANGQAIAILTQRAVERDAAVAAFEQDKQNFLDKVKEQSLRHEVSPAEKERMKAAALIEAGEIASFKRTETRLNSIKFKQKLDAEPKEMITSMGILELIGQPGGQPPQPVIQPEVIRVNGATYWLPPNKPFEVPKTIADLWRQRQRSNEENEERKALLTTEGGSKEHHVIMQGWADIDNRYDAGNIPENRVPTSRYADVQ